MTLRKAFVAVALSSLACAGFSEPAPDLAKTNTYTDHGVVLEYPGNWTVQGTDEQGYQEVTVESPGSALVIVQRFQAGVSIDLDQAMRDMVGGMQEAAAEMSGDLLTLPAPRYSHVARTIAGRERDGRRAEFDLELFGVKVPHTTDMYLLDEEGGPLLVYVQAPDEDRPTAEPGLDLILDTLKPTGGAPGGDGSTSSPGRRGP